MWSIDVTRVMLYLAKNMHGQLFPSHTRACTDGRSPTRELGREPYVPVRETTSPSPYNLCAISGTGCTTLSTSVIWLSGFRNLTYPNVRRIIGWPIHRVLPDVKNTTRFSLGPSVLLSDVVPPRILLSIILQHQPVNDYLAIAK